MSETTPFYFNSTSYINSDLFAAIEAAKDQNDRVMLIFKTKNRPMSPSEVWQIYKTWYKSCPLTSIRRSITTLTDQGLLVDSALFRIGIYGRPERIWRLEK